MNSLDRKLELFAANEPEAAQVDEAQRKLEALVGERVAHRPIRRARGWLAAAASAAVVAVAMLWLPFGTTPAVAFAMVQQHFKDFQTMRFEIEQRVDGELIMKSLVSVTRDGNVRTDVGDDISVIVNTKEQRVLTLIRSERIAVESPLGAPVKEDDALKWVEDVREFQGEAKVLERTRWIRGQRAHGWELPTAAGKLSLWANDEGLPLEMTMEGSTPLELSFEFEFDVPLDAQLFSTEIPAGYSLGNPED